MITRFGWSANRPLVSSINDTTTQLILRCRIFEKRAFKETLKGSEGGTTDTRAWARKVDLRIPSRNERRSPCRGLRVTGAEKPEVDINDIVHASALQTQHTKPGSAIKLRADSSTTRTTTQRVAVSHSRNVHPPPTSVCIASNVTANYLLN